MNVGRVKERHGSGEIKAEARARMFVALGGEQGRWPGNRVGRSEGPFQRVVWNGRAKEEWPVGGVP